jgi:hypothetical protein
MNYPCMLEPERYCSLLACGAQIVQLLFTGKVSHCLMNIFPASVLLTFLGTSCPAEACSQARLRILMYVIHVKCSVLVCSATPWGWLMEVAALSKAASWKLLEAGANEYTQ